MNFTRDANVWVTVELGSGKRVSAAFKVPAEQAKWLEPLPRDFDAPFSGASAAYASIQIRERHELIAMLSKELSKHIAEQLHEQDPYNGYDRSELRKRSPKSES